MLHINKVILVEGKYDKIKLESVTDALILPLDGFGVFSDREKEKAIRSVAAEKGVIVLTDPDAAGFKIRGYLNGILPREQIFHAYAPDVTGKEKRKARPSREGKLGVEGLDPAALEKILSPFAENESARSPWLTKADMFEDGLSGGNDSQRFRKAFAETAGLPARIGANALLCFINAMMSPEKYRSVLNETRAKSVDKNNRE